MFTLVTRVYPFSRVYQCLPLFTHACLLMLPHAVYSCLPMFANVHCCLVTYVYPFLLMLHLFTYVNSCLPLFTTVYSYIGKHAQVNSGKHW